MSLRTVLAENFKRLMEARRFVSLKEVTARNGGTNGTLDRIRRGASAATIDSIEQLAKALRVEPWHLLVPGFDPNKPLDAQAVRATLEAMAKQVMAEAADTAKPPPGTLVVDEEWLIGALSKVVAKIAGRKLTAEDDALLRRAVVAAERSGLIDAKETPGSAPKATRRQRQAQK